MPVTRVLTVLKQIDDYAKARLYDIYLFDRILLFTQEPVTRKARFSISRRNKIGQASPAGEVERSLKLEGRVFVQNITDVTSLSQPMRGTVFLQF